MRTKLKENFLNPSDEFTPMPFWFWNDRLEQKEIIRQINDFKDKGVMGFIIHPRIGIPKDLTYLSDEFMEFVKCAVKEAAALGMKVILYDEGMYPSGSAHGMVVQANRAYASRGLRMEEHKCTGDTEELVVKLGDGEKLVTALAVQKAGEISINPEKITKVKVTENKVYFTVPKEGRWSILTFIETYSKGTIRGIHFGEDDGQPDAPPSGDLLNPEAMKKFIELTHERYYSVLGQYFGSTIIGMFTEEPGILGRHCMPGLRPWTDNFLEWYIELGNSEFDLPVLWFDAGKETEKIRKNYRHAVNKRLENTYYKPISNWCREHGISFTGHPERSDDIGFLKHFHIPGQDIVWRWVAPEEDKGITGEHSTMAKCSSDAARHSGKRRNANECFGCCGPEGIHWAFSAADMKWYLDWLFVRGVNMIYPHAFYYSVNGEGRFNERPPDVGPNNIWWKHYKNISDYIKRMSWLMTDSINQAEVAVLCSEDRLPWEIVKPLYENQIEFNYLEECLLLTEQLSLDEGVIQIENQRYSVLLVDKISMLEGGIKEKLEKFISCGGKVIIYNPQNKLMPLENALQIKELDELIHCISKIICRDILFEGGEKELRVSHVQKEGMHFFLLANEGNKIIEGNIRLGVKGKVANWDPWSGNICEETMGFINGEAAVMPVRIKKRESIILAVDPHDTYVFGKEKREHLVQEEIELNDHWVIKGLPNSRMLSGRLFSWTKFQDTKNYSGTLIYEHEFETRDLGGISYIKLQLGSVYEIAEVFINDICTGVKLWEPYSFDLKEYVREGRNTLAVKITNSLANKYDKAKLTSGLLGPVRVIMGRNSGSCK